MTKKTNNNKLCVLQVNKLYFPFIGGVEKVVQQIAEGLKNKTDMQVLACQPRGRGRTENINGVKVHKASSLGILFSLPISLDFFRQFKKLSKTQDILHIHMPFPLADLAVFLFRPKCKIALWWHSDIVRQKYFMFLYKPLLNWLLRRTDVIFVATAGHIDGSAYLRPFRNKCKIVPFAVDDAVIKKASAYFASNSRKIRSKNKPVQILFVGRLIYYKGCEYLLNAMREVSGAILTLVGTGKLEQKLKKQAEKLGINEKVKFVGSLTSAKLDKAFQNCDIFVLPSIVKTEAFGLVQIEAMAYGKPVINTALPSGVPYVSLHGKTGLTVPPKDSKALAQAIQKLVDDKKLREKFSQNAYKRVRENFTMEKMLESVLGVYGELLGENKK